MVLKTLESPVHPKGDQSWVFTGRTDAEAEIPILPWTERRSNQSILKEINPGLPLEGTMLKLKLQYFGHLM